MKPEAVSLVVARATVAGDPKIELVTPAEVRAKIRQPVHVKLAYRLEETSKDREEWTFTLKSSAGPTLHAPVAAKWKDRRMLPDDLWGTLYQEFTFDKPGRYAGAFEVSASLTHTNWSGGQVSKNAKRTGEGKFVVVVE